MSNFNCPSCGGQISPQFKYSKIITCKHCQSGLFLQDDAVRLRGESAVMADYPSLLALYQQFKYKNWTFEPIGHLRYEYSHGFWDEWWVINSKGQGKWISVDEGDYSIEMSVKLNQKNFNFNDLSLGKQITLFNQSVLVTELDDATCIGLEGELPEMVKLQDKFQYAHLSGEGQTLFTLEQQQQKTSLYKGTWIDAFAIQAV